MKSKLKPIGKIFLLCSSLLVACAIKTKDRGPEPSTLMPENPDTKSELSLTQDNKELEELRKNIPEPKKSENDMLRETLAMLGEVKDPPHRHRERFEKLIRKVRNDHQKMMRKKRDEFSKNERKRREDFLSKLKEDREDFLDDDPDKRQRDRFFSEQEVKRREFTADERDKRQEFEGDMREKDRDFSGNVRDKTNEFYRELRLYEKRYQEWQKAEALKKENRRNGGSSPANQPLETE